MYLQNIRLQIMSALLLAEVLFLFTRGGRLKLRSMSVFFILLVMSLINVFLDMGTVYTITHMDTVPAWINRILHALFIGTLDMLAYCEFQYVLALIRRKRAMTPLMYFPMLLPLIFALYMAAFGALYYYNDGTIAYSYGPAVYSLFGCLAFYIAASNLAVLFNKDIIEKQIRYAIHGSTLIWIVASVIQGKNPGFLISNVAVCLMALYTYLALANPREFTDQETGCFNRRAMVLMIDEWIADKKEMHIINISVDNVSELNHSRGYSTTAEALKEMTEYASQIFGDDVYRYHNTAFMIMTEMNGESLRVRAEALWSRLQHHFGNDNRVYLRTRVDLLEGAQCGSNCHDLLETLDFMLEQGDSVRHEGVYVMDDELMAHKKRIETVKTMLETALRDDGFYVVYQPIYDTHTKSFTSAEALVRMKDTETIGFVPPDEFITAAERFGYISELGNVVLEKVCEMAAQEKIWERGVSYIEVNLSGVQMKELDLAASIDRNLKKYGIDPSFLNFEITETASVTSGERLRENMMQLRNMGCSFSMDDFGTGYSNLSQMADASYDLVKLDKTLIWPCFEEGNEKARTILQNVVSMISELHTEIVAEGVETQEQVELLDSLGVRHMQGYYFSRPVKREDFVAFLSKTAEQGGEKN